MKLAANAAVLVLSICGAATLGAQDLSQYTSFTVDGKTVQFHGFVSQGFLYSNDNNYLTTDSSKGSFAFTDAAVNASVQITDKFRVGAQVYDRNLGQLGKWHPTLDWAVADYRFKDWFGIRAGQVKTVLGLYNDTQDMEFLHTFAILPQSAYPLDLRSSTIAHDGADVYGTISLKKLGDLEYTGYAGWRPYDKWGGYPYGVQNYGITLFNYPSKQMGGDLRWDGLVKGLVMGASYMHAPGSAAGSLAVAPGFSMPDKLTNDDNVNAFYADYKIGNLTVDGEYRRETYAGTTTIGPMPATPFQTDERGWYGSAAYRVSKRLELGTYRSWFYPVWGQLSSPPTNHMFDTVAAAKINLVGQWDLKVEEHFMDGYGTPYSFRGFYPQQNPVGFRPKTDMLVIRTGWNF